MLLKSYLSGKTHQHIPIGKIKPVTIHPSICISYSLYFLFSSYYWYSWSSLAQSSMLGHLVLLQNTKNSSRGNCLSFHISPSIPHTINTRTMKLSVTRSYGAREREGKKPKKTNRKKNPINNFRSNRQDSFLTNHDESSFRVQLMLLH